MQQCSVGMGVWQNAMHCSAQLEWEYGSMQCTAVLSWNGSMAVCNALQCSAGMGAWQCALQWSPPALAAVLRCCSELNSSARTNHVIHNTTYSPVPVFTLRAVRPLQYYSGFGPASQRRPPARVESRNAYMMEHLHSCARASSQWSYGEQVALLRRPYVLSLPLGHSWEHVTLWVQRLKVKVQEGGRR